MFNTPVFEFENIYVKLEYKNPAGSIKDRPAFFMIHDALKRGYREVVEVTSGNTGIALAFYAKKFGIKATIFMPESFSAERQKLLKLYGANLILTKGTIADALDEALKYAKFKSALYTDQFSNPLNAKSQEITGFEILNQLRPDFFVAGVGSGGTITGIGRVLKPLGVKIIAVESENSPVLYNRLKNANLPVKAHKIQGIGAGFITDLTDISIIDDVILVNDEEAVEFAKRLPSFGIAGGISTAANILAAQKLKGKVATVAPDGIERYLSVLNV